MKINFCDNYWFFGKSPGKPVKIDEKITKSLKEIVKNERKTTTGEVKARINVSKGILYTLLTSLGIRKLCSRFIPRFLTAEMQDRRMQCCRENLSILNSVAYRVIHNCFLEISSIFSSKLYCSKLKEIYTKNSYHPVIVNLKGQIIIHANTMQ